jgi:hypothetical protein
MMAKITREDKKNIEDFAEQILDEVMQNCMYKFDEELDKLARMLKLPRKQVYSISMKHLRKFRLLPRGW